MRTDGGSIPSGRRAGMSTSTPTAAAPPHQRRRLTGPLAEATAPGAGWTRYKVTVAYDGTDFEVSSPSDMKQQPSVWSCTAS